MRLTPAPLLLAVLAGALGCGGGSSSGPSQATDMTVIEPGHQLANPAGWYDDAVIYQVWVKSFANAANPNGIGDLPGVQGRLDYLQALGVNALWLSPIFQCEDHGTNMHGYDTVDYNAINPDFGRNEDLANLIDAVHARGMRILFDFVPNHTSTVHPWFTSSATSPDWYVWQAAQPAGWTYPWGGGNSSDVWLPGQYGFYYSAFATNTMADLNYYNPDTVAAIRGVESYWLDRGFDGLRMDAARYLCEQGPGLEADQPDTHTQLQAFRSIIDQYAAPGNAHPHPNGDASQVSVKMMMAEAWTPDATGIGPYYGNGSNEFNMCLDFSNPWAVYEAIATPDATQLTGLWEYEQAHYPAGYRSATFDSNHDNVISRPGTQYGGNRFQIVLAEALNVLAPGTPIIYYGNEVGMTGVSGTDTNLRQPMDWTAATAQSAQPDSILSWCKYLIRARSTYPALRGGYATLTTDLGPGRALAYVRSAGAERVVVVANLTGSTETVTINNLTNFGVTAGGTVGSILGAPTGATWNGSQFSAAGIPPYGLRVYYAAGGNFQGNIHGDIQ